MWRDLLFSQLFSARGSGLFQKKPRRATGFLTWSKCLAASDPLKAFHEDFVRFLNPYRDTIYRANFDALRFIIVSFALGAKIGINLVDLLAFVNCIVGAFRFTGAAVNAFISNGERHESSCKVIPMSMPTEACPEPASTQNYSKNIPAQINCVENLFCLSKNLHDRY